MLRIVNQARSQALAEQQTGKFLRYAIGEILLVVIGILIALQINNWNEERLELGQTRESVLNLAEEIRRDLEMLLAIKAQIHRLIAVGEALTIHLDEDYRNDNALAEQTIALIEAECGQP